MEKTINETKEELIRKTENIKHTIEGQISVLKDDASKAAKIAAVAGGAILLTYLIAKRFKKKKTVEFNGHQYNLAPAQRESPVTRMIKENISIFLVSIAKQMLAQYLQKLNTVKIEESSPRKTSELQEKWS